MNTTEVLQQCKVEGLVVKLPDIKLDRKDYEQVKKKLELIGGKWKGGKVCGFEFKEDPTSLLGQIVNGEDRNIKKEFQFFGTPESLAIKMVELAQIEHTHSILEPSAGQGAIIKAINKTIPHARVHYFELMPLNKTFLEKIPTGVFVGEDFLQADSELEFDRIIANPPFSGNQDIDHIKKMYSLLAPGGRLVSIASPSWASGSQKKQVEFKKWLSEIGADVEELPKGTFKESGTTIHAYLITIDKDA